jgi:cell division protein ZapD
MTRQLEFTGKFGHELRDNEWLMNIKQRTAIAGGACQFDLPSYYFWQKQSAEVRRADLQRWSAPLLATRDAVGVLLKLLRDSGKSNTFTARHGAFQQMSGGKVVHLIRITLDASLGLVPEVSANKYAVNVRFIEPTTHSARSRAATADIPFTLAFCKL